MKKTVVALFTVVCLQATYANAIAITTPTHPIHAVAKTETPTSIIFLDPETKMAYIDVKALDGAASEILVKDHTGKTVLDKDVATERTDAVIEIDMSKYAKGAYTIVVNTYSNTIKQEVVID